MLMRTLPRLTAANHQQVFGVPRGRPVPPVPEAWPEFAQQIWIRSSHGLQRFEPYEWQIKLADYLASRKPRSLICQKSRQTGCSEFWLSWAAWVALSHPGITVLVLARTMQDSYLLGRRLRTMLEGTPWDAGIDANALSHLVFSNKSSIILRSHLPESVRGISAKVVIVDEAAFSDTAPLIEAVQPTQQMIESPLLALISTPNGQSSHFYHLALQSHPQIEEHCDTARLSAPFMVLPPDPQGYHLALIHWKAIPRYAAEGDAFLERVKAEAGLSEASVKQEYELCSTESSEAVFDLVLVKRAVIAHLADPDPEARYFIGMDPAGIGADYCVAVVLAETWMEGRKIYEVVALYRRKTGTSEQHQGAVSDLVSDYRPARTIVETNAMGQLYLERLASIHPRRDIQGFATTAQSKGLLVGRITLALERGDLRILAGPIEQELLGFRRNGDRLEAAVGAHDDCVMALGLALTAAQYGIEPNTKVRGVKL